MKSNIDIRAINIADHYSAMSRMMRGLHESERALFDKTALWDDIEVSYMKHVIEAQQECDGICLVAYINDAPAGFIFGYIDEPDDSRIEEYTRPQLYVSDGYIDPQYRRQGIYKMLNDELERIYIAKGIRRIVRYTLASNTRMQSFLKSEDYQPVRLFYEKWLGENGKNILPLGLNNP